MCLSLLAIIFLFLWNAILKTWLLYICSYNLPAVHDCVFSTFLMFF